MLIVVALALAVSSSSPRPACATLAVRDAPSLAGATVGAGGRPDTVEFADSTLHPVRVHRGAGATAEQLALVVAEVDSAWALQVDGAGWEPPLADTAGFDDDGGDARLDLYLTPLVPGVGAVTISGGTATQRPVFIEIDPNQPDDLVTVAVHHEFQHALQFAVDAYESAMWFESNAVAWEVRAHPEIDAWFDLLPDFQRQPQAPLSTDSAAFAPFATSEDGTLEYGAAFFALYLDDEFGTGDGSFVRSLWTSSTQAGDVNEPDWQDALAADHDLSDTVADFAGWRALAGGFDVDGDGPAFVTDGNADVGARSILLASLTGEERETNVAEGPFVGGCSLRRGTAPAGDDIALRVSAISVDGHDLIAVATVIDVANRSAVRTRSGRSPQVQLDVDVGRGLTVIAGVCDVSARDADDAPLFAPIRLRLARTDAVAEGEGEGDVSGEGEGEGDDVVDCGCCCQAPGPSRGPPQTMQRSIGYLSFFGGVVAFSLRAWRHLKRKRLYKESEARRAAEKPRD